MEILGRERVYALVKAMLKEKGERYSSSHRLAIDEILDIVDDEFLEKRKDDLVTYQKNLEEHARFLNSREKNIERDSKLLDERQNELKDFEEELKTRKQSLENIGDERAINAYKFAKEMGDLFRLYPENIVTAMSYSVWAYLGGEKRPEVGE